MGRYPYPGTKNIQILKLLIFPQQLWICYTIPSKFIQKWPDVLLHICVSLIVDIRVFELVLIANFSFGLLLCLLYLRFLHHFLYMVQFMLFLPPLIFLIVQVVKLLIQFQLLFYGLLLSSPPFQLQVFLICFEHVLQIFIMLIIIFKGNHVLKSSGFIFLIIKISPLLQSFYFISNVFDLLQLVFCVEIFLIVFELLDLLANAQYSFEILFDGAELVFVAISYVFVLDYTHIMQSYHSLFIDFPVLLLVKTILDQKLIDFLFLLRMEKTILLILEIGMSIHSHQINRGRFTLLFIKHSHFDKSTLSRHLNPNCIIEIIYFSQRGKLMSIF